MRHIYLGLAIVFCSTILQSDSVILFHFKPYPLIKEPRSFKKFVSNLSYPGKIARNKARFDIENNLKNFGVLVSGIVCSYAGFITASDASGTVTFPRLQTSSELYIFVTTKISPIAMSQNTISHWELEEGTPAQLYRLTQLKNPLVWEVSEVSHTATFSQGKIIPLNTIIIFNNPKNIYIPTGNFRSFEGPNLILPPVYVRKGVSNVYNALYVININHLFRNLIVTHQLQPTRYRMLLDYQ